MWKKLTYFSPSAVTTENLLFSESLRVNFVVFNVFTGYNIGCKVKVCTWKTARDVDLKNGSLEICNEKMPAPGVVCYKYVTLALKVTSSTFS